MCVAICNKYPSMHAQYLYVSSQDQPLKGFLIPLPLMFDFDVVLSCAILRFVTTNNPTKISKLFFFLLLLLRFHSKIRQRFHSKIRQRQCPKQHHCDLRSTLKIRFSLVPIPPVTNNDSLKAAT